MAALWGGKECPLDSAGWIIIAASRRFVNEKFEFCRLCVFFPFPAAMQLSDDAAHKTPPQSAWGATITVILRDEVTKDLVA